MDETAKKRIIEITVQMVTGKIEREEFDPEIPGELKRVTRECAVIARSAYFAALEFLAG